LDAIVLLRLFASGHRAVAVGGVAVVVRLVTVGGVAVVVLTATAAVAVVVVAAIA
jgi:hypothetical protein